jgi:geranylgeranyl transferase type-1 subunit beta
MVKYLNHCINEFDQGIGMNPDNESHGGAIFCAIGALVLSGRLMQFELNQEELIRWCVSRQVCSNGQKEDGLLLAGFQGRCNKIPTDSCYAYWIGGTLELLGQHELMNTQACCRFIFSCQNTMKKNAGGFCKYPYTFPDVMHSYFSLAWLSIQEHSSSSQKNQQQQKNILMPFDTKLQVPFFLQQ